MEQHVNPDWQLAGYRAGPAPSPESKVDNRAYAIAALAAWAEIAGSEPVAVIDPSAVPEQAIPPALAAGYPDLLA